MATINILGDIGASVQAEDIITQIQEAKGDKIKVIIASPGGSAFQGLMIHDALKASGKEVTTIALGLGASAAFIIFLAGDKREMGDATLLMAHNSRTELCGTASQIRDDLAAMDAIDDRMKSVVMGVSGMSDEDATDFLSKDNFMNSKTAMKLGLATDSIQDDIAASLNMNKTKKEPVKMATEEETKQAGFLAYIAAYFKSEVKAEADDEERKEDEDAKAESEDEDVEVEEEKETKEAKAGVHEDEDKEEAKAEGDDDKEKEEMKAKIESLESELAATKAEHEEEDEDEKKEEEAKVSSILKGITDKKVTMHTAINLSKKSPSEVSAFLKDLQPNATKRGKTEEPKSDASSKFDQWKAMKSDGNHGSAQKFYTKNYQEISSEMNKEK